MLGLLRRYRWRCAALLLVAVILFAMLLTFATLPTMKPDDLGTGKPLVTSYMRYRAAQDGHYSPSPIAEWIGLDEISPLFSCAVIKSEDVRFFSHRGFDWVQVARAGLEAASTGELKEGASTITQQLARNVYLSPDRTIKRKAQEAILARRIERRFPKRKILEAYLNVIELGRDVWGVSAAANTYFLKEPSELDAFEASLLAAMIPSPRAEITFENQDRIAATQGKILEQLYLAQALPEQELHTANSKMQVFYHELNRGSSLRIALAAAQHFPAFHPTERKPISLEHLCRVTSFDLRRNALSRPTMFQSLVAKIRGQLYDWKTGQRPLMSWSEVERMYADLPKAGREEIERSAYADYFGEYPPDSPYAAPIQFIRVDRDNQYQFIFRNWRLSGFLPWHTRTEDVWPQYIAIDKAILQKLQLTFDCLTQQQTLDVAAVRIGDAFRPPAYNFEAVHSRDAGKWSQHMYGTAVDLYLGDVTRDGVVDLRDRAVIERCVDAVDSDPRHKYLWGGRSSYNDASILHVDSRGEVVRWK